MPAISDSFGHWLAGFVAGEGSFNIQKNGRGAYYCSFRLALHAEDIEILYEIQRRTGLGQTWEGHPPSQKGPRALWTVQAKAECLALVGVFERFPLRAKKQRDFLIWAKAVRAWQSIDKTDKATWTKGWPMFEQYRSALRSGRSQRGVKAVIA